MIFLTEGDSASGTITKTRDVKTQAVFSLRGKVKNVEGEKLLADHYETLEKNNFCED